MTTRVKFISPNFTRWSVRTMPVGPKLVNCTHDPGGRDLLAHSSTAFVCSGGDRNSSSLLILAILSLSNLDLLASPRVVCVSGEQNREYVS